MLVYVIARSENFTPPKYKKLETWKWRESDAGIYTTRRVFPKRYVEIFSSLACRISKDLFSPSRSNFVSVYSFVCHCSSISRFWPSYYRNRSVYLFTASFTSPSSAFAFSLSLSFCRQRGIFQMSTCKKVGMIFIRFTKFFHAVLGCSWR